VDLNASAKQNLVLRLSCVAPPTQAVSTCPPEAVDRTITPPLRIFTPSSSVSRPCQVPVKFSSGQSTAPTREPESGVELDW